MPTINLSSFKPSAGTVADAGQIDNAFDALQTLLNGGLDKNNLAAAAGILASQLAGYPDDDTKFLAGDGNWAVPSTGVLAYGTRTSNVSTSGITFATGADLLAADLSFTADGTSDYMVEVSAEQVAAGSSESPQIRLNLDTADAGYMWAQTLPSSAGAALSARTVILAPSAGTHTVNAKLVSGASAVTVTVSGGSGGAATARPILVTVAKL